MFSQNNEYILFSFWKALEVLRLHTAAPGPTAALRESLCETMIALVERCSGCMRDHVLLAQSFCLVAEMYPDSIFLHDVEDCVRLCKDSASRNRQIKHAALKLIQGALLVFQMRLLSLPCNASPDAINVAQPSRGTILFCSRLTDFLVSSLIGLRQMAADSTVPVFDDLTNIGTQNGVCVCSCRASLELVRDVLGRQRSLDDWAPVTRAAVGDGFCAMCMQPMSSQDAVRVRIAQRCKLFAHYLMQIRQIRCPGQHSFCAECVENWLVYKKHDSCPVCRHNCTQNSSLWLQN